MPEPEQLEDISSASEAKGNDVTPDADAKKEAEQIANESRKENLRGQKSDNDARIVYANRIFCLMAVWLVAIFFILILQGFLGKDETFFSWSVSGPYGSFMTGIMHFNLSTEVIVALIGSTTATVLGLFAIVAHYLFPEKK